MAEFFHVSLTPDQETAPSPSLAHGEGDIHWYAEMGLLTFDLHLTGVDLAPIGGAGPGTEATADDVVHFHLHNGDRGEAGPVVYEPDFTLGADGGILAVENPDGTWDVHGVLDTGDPAVAALADLLTGAKPGDDAPFYFNVHTTGVSTGEIRGQWVAAEADHGLAHHCWEADAALA